MSDLSVGGTPGAGALQPTELAATTTPRPAANGYLISQFPGT
jgi:hypothetical protein